MRKSKKACKFVLARLSREPLQKLSDRMGLPSYGSRNAMIDRILKAHEGDHRDLIALLRGPDLKEILSVIEDEGMVSGKISGTVGQMASRLKRIVTRQFSVGEEKCSSNDDLHGKGTSALTSLFSKESLSSAAERLELSGKGSAGEIMERILWFYEPCFLTIMKSLSLKDLKGAARALDMSPSAGRDELAIELCRQLGLDAIEIDRQKPRARQVKQTRDRLDENRGNNYGIDDQMNGGDEEMGDKGAPDPDFACFGAYRESADACLNCDVKNKCADAALKARGIFGDAERILNAAAEQAPKEILKAKKTFDYGPDEEIHLDDLNRRYKDLQRKWHPDHVGDKPIEFVNTYAEMSKLINEMYEVLKRCVL